MPTIGSSINNLNICYVKPIALKFKINPEMPICIGADMSVTFFDDTLDNWENAKFSYNEVLPSNERWGNRGRAHLLRPFSWTIIASSELW